MIHIPGTWRVFGGAITASFIGVMAIAGGTASADPVFPQPPSPAPMPASAAQNHVTNGLDPAPPTVLAPTLAPPVSGTLRDYLQAQKVTLEPQQPQGFKALDIVLPMPPRWTQVPDPNVPDAFAVIADRVGGNSVYTSNAQVVVYRLIGDFNPSEAIAHGYGDSQQLLAWQTTKAGLVDFHGFPSSLIEGTYRENGMTLNSSRRHVIATSGTDKYLVSLTVTTAASQAVADAPATDAIINGFQVVAPSAAAPAPAAVNHSVPTGQPPLPSLLALMSGLPPLPSLMLGPQR